MNSSRSTQEEALRIYLRDLLPPRASVEAERLLDSVLEVERRKTS